MAELDYQREVTRLALNSLAGEGSLLPVPVPSVRTESSTALHRTSISSHL